MIALPGLGLRTWGSSILFCLALYPGAAAIASDVSFDRESLQVLPTPDTGRLEEAAQQQMHETRAILQELLENPAIAPVELAESFGLLGQLYYVYEFEDLAEICFENARQLQPEDYRWHYFVAVLARLEGDWQAAKDSLTTVLDMRPGDEASLIRLAEAQLELGDLTGAEATYGEVLNLAPDLAVGHAGRGRVAYGRGEYSQAIEDFQRALELQPEATSLHHRLGMAYRQAGDLEAARAQLALNTGGYVRFPDPLIAGAGALIQSKQVYFNTGIVEVRKGNFDKAIQYFRRALAEQPDDSLAAYNLGLALLKKGARQEGLEWLATSVELDPDFRNGHFNLAMLLAEDGRWVEVIEHLSEAHRIDPEDRNAHLELATALTKVGRNQDALIELGKLLELHPRDAEALLNLGTLLAASGRDREAAEVFSRLLEGGGDPELQSAGHGQLGSLLESRGATEEALIEYQAAADLAPESVQAQANLAAALGRTGRFAQAAEAYSRVVTLAPERIDGHFGRAMALILAEQYPAARRALEESLETHPQSVALAHALARLLATSPDASVRDGDRALGMAQAVFNAESSLEHAETMAMALAEVGQFDEAVDLQRQVVEEADRQGQPQLASRARSRLERYEAGEPCRAPWRDG